MKAEVFEGSILRGSNKLYIVSNNRKVATPHNALLKIASNETLFKIESSEELNIKRPFISPEENEIKIKGNYNYKITRGDSVNLYYEEWKASSAELVNGGSNLNAGEILYCQEGVVSNSTQNITGQQCEIKVVKVTEKGEVSQIEIHKGGAYTQIPEGIVTAINEKDIPIKVKLEFEPAESTPMVQREVESVTSTPIESTIKLSYRLPLGVDSGEMIVPKQVIYIDREFNFEDCYCGVCTITKDFSPKNRLPLMAPNTPNVHTIYNQAIELLEQKFTQMENRLKELERIRH
tara:strand:+ start:288 stop:1160 length:873 start_codon:yes stop_codon:yes gene_type:complete